MTDRTCTIAGCDRPHRARGWCGTHYKRWTTTGDPGGGEVRAVTRRLSEVCAVDGCDRARVQREWCKAHYARWHKHGDVGSADVLDRSEPRICSIDGCTNPHDSNGYCSPHAHRARRYAHPEGRPTKPPAGDRARWRKDEVGYMGAHNRTRRLKGNAKCQSCTHCGNPAHDWAYDHEDPNELHDDIGGYVVPYSVDPDHYIALCKSCHTTFDKQAQCCS